MIHGNCLCGGVAYEAEGPFEMMVHCHCSMCRKHHGSSFATFVAAPLDGFRWLRGEDLVSTYASSAEGQRSFCRICGSVAPMLAADAGLAILPAGNLEEDPGIRPQLHMFVASKAPWDEIGDDLPQFDAYPPGFDSPGIQRPALGPHGGVTRGSCLCGDVRFECSGDPLRIHSCHCKRCQRARSAAYATNAFYPLTNFRWTEGKAQVTDYALPGAKFFGTSFCSRCGGMVARESPVRGVASVPLGALDTDPGMRPQRHIYVGSKAAWDSIHDSLPQHEEGLPPQ